MALVRVFLCMALVALAAGVAAADDPAPAPTEVADRAVQLSAERGCAAHVACDWFSTFAPLERASLSRALAARGVELEPSPWGKTIAKIHIYTEDVFVEKNFLRFFNHFHWTTREHALREELPINEGDRWNDELVAEAARLLHDPLYSSVVVLVPVKSAEPGAVDLLVVTRDVFSIRLNTQFKFQEGSLTSLQISLSENNFLGQRDLFSASMIMDQGAISFGPLFVDKNVFGKHIYLYARVAEIFTRRNLDVILPVPMDAPPNTEPVHLPTTDPKGIQDGGGLSEEGREATITLARPLWSLASEWGGRADFGYIDAIHRNFYATGLSAAPLPSTDLVVPWEYHTRSWSLEAKGERQWGSVLKHQLSIGYRVQSVSPTLLSNFPTVSELQQDFMRYAMPRTEQLSGPKIAYSFYQPRFAVVRNLRRYELAEDLRLGPDLEASLWQGLRTLRSDAHFTQPSIVIGWTLPWCRDGFVRPQVGGALRIQDYTYPEGGHVDTIDNTAEVQLTAATPMLGWFRLAGQADLSTRWHDTQNGYYYLGGDPGLRGYNINVLTGRRAFISQLELRTLPTALWVLRVGGVLFYDVGGTASSLAHLGLYHDVGVGVRILVPQTSRELIRIDVAVPLQYGPDGAKRFYPHPLLSYESAF